MRRRSLTGSHRPVAFSCAAAVAPAVAFSCAVVAFSCSSSLRLQAARAARPRRRRRSSRSRSATPTTPTTPLLPPQPPGHADHAASPTAAAGPSWIGSAGWQAWNPRTAARGRNRQKLLQAAATSPLFRSHQDKDLNQIHQLYIKDQTRKMKNFLCRLFHLTAHPHTCQFIPQVKIRKRKMMKMMLSPYHFQRAFG
uniref:Uncharacterized protein n=1 Tax=Oryza rufipogon TaxID=4529 RepID=A0A0E0MVE2_ORYRU